MGQLPPDPVGDRARETLEALVLRARRVAAHSLARDGHALAELCNPTYHVTIEPGRPATLTRTLPPEEAIESLGARVRPLILKDEPVHWGKTLKALGYLLKDVLGAAAATEYLAVLKDEWAAIDSKSDKIRAYRVEVGPADGSAAPTVMSDNALAFAWIYGDVVHADATRRGSASAFDIDTRYEAAVPTVAHVALLACRTLQFVEQLIADGMLTLSASCFAEAVTVEVTEIVSQANIYVGPAGAAPPLAGEPLGADWVTLSGDDTSSAP